jgi:hypothetical protein
MDADENKEGKKEKEKRIVIEGTSNRYQIKKLIGTKERKKRVVASEWILPPAYLAYEKQCELLQLEKEKEEKKEEKENHLVFALLNRELERKLASYKQQDKEKGIMDFLSFITLEKVKRMLETSHLKCFYCSCEVFLFYEMVRENKQWTLDRINNDLGHNEGNVVVACLECNLKRRRTHQDKFLFTKQLKITKES